MFLCDKGRIVILINKILAFFWPLNNWLGLISGVLTFYLNYHLATMPSFTQI